MNEYVSESGGSPRENLAQVKTLLDGVFLSSASELPPESELPAEWVDAIREELTALPSSAALATYEHRLWQAFLSYDPPSASHGDGDELIVLGWLTTTFHQAHAAFRLATEGLGEIAVANVRAAMEHAFYLSAFVNAEDSEVIFNSITFRHRKGLERVLDFARGQVLPEGGMSLVEAVTLLILGEDDQKPTISWPEKIEQVCNRLNTGERLYFEYRILSEQLHPGISSVLLPAVLDHPRADGSTVADLDASEAASFYTRRSLRLAIGACAWAGWVADRFFTTDYFGPLLAEFANELGFLPIFKTEARP